jgi:hypothetical protein
LPLTHLGQHIRLPPNWVTAILPSRKSKNASSAHNPPLPRYDNGSTRTTVVAGAQNVFMPLCQQLPLLFGKGRPPAGTLVKECKGAAWKQRGSRGFRSSFGTRLNYTARGSCMCATFLSYTQISTHVLRISRMLHSHHTLFEVPAQSNNRPMLMNNSGCELVFSLQITLLLALLPRSVTM